MDDPAPRRVSVLWWIACAGAVAVAVVVALVLVTGHAGDGDRDAAAGTPTSQSPAPPEPPGPPAGTGGGYDLRTPEAAAESFAAAAASGSGEELLSLACVGHLACVREHAADLGGARLTDARTVIEDNVFELAHHLEGAEFTKAVDGTAPGTREVPYRTPEMTGDAYLTLTFVRSEGNWLYLAPAA